MPRHSPLQLSLTNLLSPQVGLAMQGQQVRDQSHLQTSAATLASISTTIFDIQVTDTEALSYQGQDPHKILAKHKKEKKDKYVEACLDWPCHFTPLVFLVDGLQGEEASAATKPLALHLAAKWKCTYY
jgi:hypothetical protein